MVSTRRRFRILFIIGALTAILVAAGTPGPLAGDDPQRLGRDVVPVYQEIDLKIDADADTYTGRVAIDLTVSRAAPSFRLHAEEMTFETVTLTGPDGEIGVTHGAADAIGLVTLTPERPLAPGSYKLTIAFSNAYGTKATGLYKVVADGAGYLFTQFEADDAREAFPCWDEPEFKIPFRMTLRVPEKHIGITNTPVEKESTADGWRTYRFMKTKPLPTYLLAIASGPLETVPIPGMKVPGHVVVPRGQTALAQQAVAYTPRILAAMEDWFGSPYPYEKLDLIAIPEYWPGAMENPGAITFKDTILLVDGASASAAQLSRLARVTAHELAHMWFGDLVTMTWWDDLWLNESFADWAGDKITDRVFPEFQLPLREMESIQDIMGTDARPSTPAIRKEVRAVDQKFEGLGVAYDKGKAVLSMFERWIGEENFRKGVMHYLDRHAWGNAEAGDLWRALSEVSGKELSAAMETFLTQNGVPLVGVEPLEGGRIRLTQQRFLNHGITADPRAWKIPVTLRYPSGDMTSTTTVMVDRASQEIQLPVTATPEWIFPDADGAGYYRWAIPGTMLEALTSQAREVLNPRERIAMLGNLSALMYAGGIGGDGYLRALRSFSDDTEPLVLSFLVSLLDSVKLAFAAPETEEDFALYVRQTLTPALDRFGMTARPGEPEAVSLFRPRLIGWLGVEGRHPEVIKLGGKLARDYMKDPASVDPSLAGVALRIAATHGDKALFDAYRAKVGASRTPDERSRYLSALGFFRDPALMRAALDMMSDESIRANEMFSLVGGLGDTPAATTGGGVGRGALVTPIHSPVGLKWYIRMVRPAIVSSSVTVPFAPR